MQGYGGHAFLLLDPRVRFLFETIKMKTKSIALLFALCSAMSSASAANIATPAGGMWKQPSVGAVISEEEKLRRAVFAAVYAELSSKDNASLGFSAQP